jgi:putative NADH-flavin reductase
VKVAVFGATGQIGSVIVNELLSRGHEVTAVVRDPANYTLTHDQLSVTIGDVSDVASIASAVAGHDAVVSSISSNRTGNHEIFRESPINLINGLKQAGVKRLVVVGGAGSLEINGARLVDGPDFPADWFEGANAHADGLKIYRAEGADIEWTFFSPAIMILPGERTGKFRLGGDSPVFDADGKSEISIEDYAVALVDELENPQHIRARFTIGY